MLLTTFDWMDWGTYNMYTAQWWKDVVINVYLMCLHVAYRILATTRKNDTSQALRKNTWRLHGITCRLTRSCKVHFAGKYPYLHVYNIHCRKKKLHFASATHKTCNIAHATHHFFHWVDCSTYTMSTAQWCKDVVVSVYIICLRTVYAIHASSRRKIVAEYDFLNAYTTE